MSDKIVTFILTQDCQLQCKYCYLVSKNKFGKMPIEVARKTVDLLFLYNYKFPESSIIFNFIGGEPLLEIDLINEISAYIVHHLRDTPNHWNDHYYFRITTNGLLYDSHKVQQYIKKYYDHLSLSISIDGAKNKNDLNRIYRNGKGSYDDIISNVHLWVNQFHDVNTRMVVSHHDLPYIKDSTVHLIELGIKSIDINLVVEDVWKDGDDLIFENQLINLVDYLYDNNLSETVKISLFNRNLGNPIVNDNISSACGSVMLCVDSKGNFFPCMRFAQYSLRSKPERTIGNIDEGINWNRLRPFYATTRESYSPQKCLDCEISFGCRLCPAENYDSALTRTIFQRSTAICNMHKATVRANNYYWNKLYSYV